MSLLNHLFKASTRDESTGGGEVARGASPSHSETKKMLRGRLNFPTFFKQIQKPKHWRAHGKCRGVNLGTTSGESGDDCRLCGRWGRRRFGGSRC